MHRYPVSPVGDLLRLKVRSSHPRSSHSAVSKTNNYKNNFQFVIKTLNQLLEELELKAKNKGIKGHNSTPINKLLSILNASEPIK